MTVNFGLSNFKPEPDQAPAVRINTLSPQQMAAVDWVTTGRGNCILEAVAGSGKTTTIIEMVKAAVKLQPRTFIDVAAYNKKIADEIAGKMIRAGLPTTVKVGTFHSFGWGAWRKAAPDCKLEGLDVTGRYPQAGYFKFRRIAGDMDLDPIYHSFVKALVSLAKQRCIGVVVPISKDDAWWDIVDHFDLEGQLADEDGRLRSNHEELLKTGVTLAQEVLQRGNAIAREVVDFDDQIYLPLMAHCRVWQNDWLFVDEAQDINPARRFLAKKMLKPGGRAVFVGDRHQAIYGFTGADSDSLDIIRHEFNAKDIPLTVSWRCPKLVVEHAQAFVSHIRAAETAIDGVVKLQVRRTEFMQTEFQPTDAILCRKNAPLIGLAYSLIRRGVPCHVEGREIGRGIIELASKWKVNRMDVLVNKLKEYKIRQIARLMAKGRELEADQITDKVDTLLAFIEGMPPASTVADLKKRVESMFADTADGTPALTLTLSSIHKSKGREWPRVFLYGRNLWMPSKFARQDWQMQQETNLHYVAITRAMDTFVDVEVQKED